jgi:hypothetical protein
VAVLSTGLHEPLQPVDRSETEALKRVKRIGGETRKRVDASGKKETVNAIKTNRRYLVVMALAAGLIFAGCQV